MKRARSELGPGRYSNERDRDALGVWIHTHGDYLNNNAETDDEDCSCGEGDDAGGRGGVVHKHVTMAQIRAGLAGRGLAVCRNPGTTTPTHPRTTGC